MSAWPVLGVWLFSSVVMTIGWLRQYRTRNAGLVDVIWSFLMAASAVFYAVIGPGATLPRVVVALLGGVWGCRLGLHLAHRVGREPEDGRYSYLRKHWNDDQRKWFAFFMGQALFVAVFSLPFYFVASNPVGDWTLWTTAGALVWVLSIGGEALADRQLAVYRADPANKGRTCRSGLWRYSRHPNYFFEWTHWFAYVLLTVGAPAGLVAASFIGPALMLASLYWISGIPFVEQQALRSRGDDYREYQRTTSPLIPWFPRS